MRAKAELARVGRGGGKPGPVQGGDSMEFVLKGILGLLGFIGIAWLLSENRLGLPWRQQAKLVAVGLLLQCGAAVLLLKFIFFKEVFLILNSVVFALQDATIAGTTFVFGFLGGGELPFAPPTGEL